MNGTEQAAIRAIALELSIWRAGTSAIRTVVPEIRRVVDVESIMVMSPVVERDGLSVERFESDGFRDGDLVHRLFSEFFVTAPPTYAWYNAAAPEPWQRNRLVDALDLMSPDELRASRIYEQVLVPGGLATRRQPRTLLCEGATLLGWFGAFHSGAVEDRHVALLSRLAAPIRQRLMLDRRLTASQRHRHGLIAGLEEMGAPALVIDRDGGIVEANAAGRALLASQRAELRAGLEAAFRGACTSFAIELTPIDEPGIEPLWLALVRDGTDARIASQVDDAARSWRLTPRQGEVLAMIVRGAATTSIALEMGVTSRAVELHISALFERAQVATRAALVAAVLAPSDNRSTSALVATDVDR